MPRLVDVVVADDVSVVLFFADEFCIDDFVALVARETVERFDDGFEIEAFLDRLDHVLALWASILQT